MATVRPSELPAAASVATTAAFVVDTGSSVEKATPAQIIDAAIPLASQAEAEAGANNAKRVTPLRVKQAIDALGLSASKLAATGVGEGAGLVGFIQAGDDATARKVQDELRDTISVKQFGAAGNGTDASAAFRAAVMLASITGRTVGVPDGEYLLSAGVDERSVVLPIGVNVRGTGNATILLNTANAGVSAFIPLGKNRIEGLNFDGQSLAEEDAVEDTAAWINASHAIRAYANTDFGRGAENVTVEGCRFRNLRFAIQTEGQKNWKISRCHFERTQLSAMLHQANTDFSCRGIQIEHCTFADLGDYFVAFAEVAGNSNGESCYNTVSNCFGARTNLVTNGHAVGWELAHDAALQHHNTITNFYYERGRPDITFNRGIAVMNTNTDFTMHNVGGIGERDASNLDRALIAEQSVRGSITGCKVSRYSGSGIFLDLCDTVVVDETNVIAECGKPGSPPVWFSSNGGRNLTITPTVVTSTNYNGYAANATTVYGYMSQAGQTLENIKVGGRIDRPIDAGIAVFGFDASNRAKNIEIVAGTQVIGYPTGEPASTFFESYAVRVRFAEDVKVCGKFRNAKYGVEVRDTAGVTLEVEFTGSETLAVAAWLAGSTNINSDRNIIRCPVTSRLNGALPTALGSTSFFGMNDALFPIVNAADDAAAATAGVNVGMYYHNAGAVRRRVA